MAEQIDRNEKSRAYRKDLKRTTKRTRRRAEKVKPDEAPTKNRYRGYSI